MNHSEYFNEETPASRINIFPFFLQQTVSALAAYFPSRRFKYSCEWMEEVRVEKGKVGRKRKGRRAGGRSRDSMWRRGLYPRSAAPCGGMAGIQEWWSGPAGGLMIYLDPRVPVPVSR